MRRCEDFSYFAMNLLMYMQVLGQVYFLYKRTLKTVHRSQSLKCLLFVFSLFSFLHPFSFVYQVLRICLYVQSGIVPHVPSDFYRKKEPSL